MFQKTNTELKEITVVMDELELIRAQMRISVNLASGQVGVNQSHSTGSALQQKIG